MPADNKDKSAISMPMRLTLWGAFVAAALCAMLAQPMLERSRQASRNAQLEAYRRDVAVTAAALQQINQLYRKHWLSGVRFTVEELSKELNNGEPLPMAEDSVRARKWMQRPDGFVILLDFDLNDEWTNYRVLPGRTAPPPLPPDNEYQRALATVVAVSTRLFTMWLWMPLWIVLMFMMGIAPRDRRAIRMELFLAAAIACFIGRLLNPTWVLRGVVPNPPGMLTFVIVFFTLAALVYRFWKDVMETRRTLPQVPKCYNCGYNLTGNVSGICPECGTPIEIETVAHEKAHG